jgi:hypothetical protein
VVGGETNLMMMGRDERRLLLPERGKRVPGALRRWPE